SIFPGSATRRECCGSGNLTGRALSTHLDYSLPDRNYVLGRKGDEKTVGREKIVQAERKKTHIRRTIMNAFDLLLDQWTQQVKEIFPALHHSQQQSIAFCVQGIIQSGNAVMQRVAEAVWEHSSSETKMVSHERRFQRFVANERIEVESCWNSFLQEVLPFWHEKPVTLILDMTPYTEEATIVYVGIV